MRKVYVIANRHWNMQKADQFGELVFLCGISMPKFQIQQMLKSFYPKLENSDEDDYLLLSGLSVMNAVAASIMTYLHGKVNFLIHSKELDEYVACTIDLTLVEESMHKISKNKRSYK